MTTAATVWLAAAVGVMTSAGGVWPATVATAIALAGLVLLRSTKPYVHRHSRHALVRFAERVRTPHARSDDSRAV